ncbi:MAG: YIP1 family protein [Clostridia bacterium]|nr:YIP1 family protein [Clostridia bacterium]
MKRGILTRIALFAACIVTAAGALISAPARADTPYKTYTVNGYGEIRETQTAYLAHETILKFGDEAMNSPNDICVTADGRIYVADTGSGRILIGNADSELLGIVGEGVLKTPKGVDVTPDGHIYVADRDLNAVVEFDENGTELHRYLKPENPLYGETMSYLPIKITVNGAGLMYVVCESNTNGIVELSPLEGGTFLGYFGTNYASRSLQTIIYRIILTDAQRAKMVSNIPATPDNLDIDSRGLICTVTRGDGINSLKRLNIAGANLIKKAEPIDNPAAVAAGNHDNIYVADQQGYIYEYDNDGDLIFVFGGRDDGTQRIGLSSMVSGLDVDANDALYVLDSNSATIQVYEPTEFTDLLHSALYLYSKGQYTESREPLGQVLRMNSLFDLANKAMGRAYFQEENYGEALRYARLSKDRTGYSDAYWEVRNAWLKKNLATVIVILIALAVLLRVLKTLDKKHGIFAAPRRALAKAGETKYISSLRYGFRYMRHPIDASYGIAREGRASRSASLTLLILFIAEFLINKYLCGFLQKTVQEGRYEFFTDIGAILLIAAGVTLCTYLICSINDGEGNAKRIFTVICFSLTPYILLTPVSFALSHVLTGNEQFLITLTQVITYGWMAVLLVTGIREVNNYSAKETAKVILLTLFTALILALLIFIVYVLWAQVVEFISAVIGEVSYRAG